MMKILGQMIRYYRNVFLGLPVLFAISAAIERTFELKGAVLLIWMMSALILFLNGSSYKAFFTANNRWLSSLPISRVRFALIAVMELVFNIFLIGYSLILALLFIYWMLPSTDSTSSMIDKPVSSPMTTASLLIALLSLVISSPALFSWQFGKLGWQKILGWSSNANSLKQRTIAWTVVAVAFILIYLAPDATSYLLAGMFSAGMGAISWHQLFLTQRSWDQAKTYGSAIIASVLGIFFLQTEVVPPPNERPVARVELYGDLAPQLSRADLMRAMSQEKESDEKLARFAKNGMALPNEKKPIAIDELKSWIAQSEENPKAFVHGLTMFANDIWDQPSLLLLEESLLKRCPGGLHTSTYRSHLVCQIDARLNQMLTIKVKNLESIYDFLTPDHPVLSAFALTFMSNHGILPPMRDKVLALSQSKNEVLAHRARFALTRLHANNDAEKWLCMPEPLSMKFKCNETGLVEHAPLAFETKMARSRESFAKISVLDWQKPE